MRNQEFSGATSNPSSKANKTKKSCELFYSLFYRKVVVLVLISYKEFEKR